MVRYVRRLSPLVIAMGTLYGIDKSLGVWWFVIEINKNELWIEIYMRNCGWFEFRNYIQFSTRKGQNSSDDPANKVEKFDKKLLRSWKPV